MNGRRNTVKSLEPKTRKNFEKKFGALNYDSPAALGAFLAERGFAARKKLGQNFLINPRARAALLDALAPNEGDAVWEVGPGLGAMTAGLLDRGAVVSAFEIDPGFSQILREFFAANPRFTLIEGDVLKTWRQSGAAGSLFLGNLPYNIGATLLGDLIEGGRFFTRMVVTLQKEVARRIMAKSGSKDYGGFSLLCASAYRVTPLMVLKGPSFYPPPHVDSQALRLELRTDRDPAAYPPLFHPLLRRLFAARRKTVKNNLLGFVAGRGHKDALDLTLAALARCGIKSEARPEALSLEAFTALAQALSDLTENP